jgi:hypothetical protein
VGEETMNSLSELSILYFLESDMKVAIVLVSGFQRNKPFEPQKEQKQQFSVVWASNGLTFEFGCPFC